MLKPENGPLCTMASSLQDELTFPSVENMHQQAMLRIGKLLKPIFDFI